MNTVRTIAARAYVAPDRYLPMPAFECIYYVLVVYSMLGDLLPFSIPLAGAASTLLLAAVCAVRMSSRLRGAILTTIWAPVACALSYALIQTLVHGETIVDEPSMQQLTLWMAGLFIVHYLSLRAGFVHRFAFVIVVIGIFVVPYLQQFSGDETRASLDRRIAISNPNDLGAWFGFCSVYFIVLALEVRRTWVRAVAWTAAVGCLLVIGLSVSRGPLLAVACSAVFALRRVLRRGFVPLLMLVVVAWVSYVTGLFDRVAGLYIDRAFDESGRLLVWPLAIGRFLDSPLAGVGIRDIGTYILEVDAIVVPHNAFILMALSSGLAPFVFFVATWVQQFARVWSPRGRTDPDASFQVSLLIYAVLIAMNLNEPFTSPWTLATFAFVGRGVVVDRLARVRARAHARYTLLAGRGLLPVDPRGRP
jgi:O-antigen ligase